MLTRSGEDQWTFRGRADTAVTVELTSEEFDPYVELFGPSGELVAANDDGGEGTDSTIRDHALDASGDYTVVARGYNDAAEGRYSLLLSRGVVDGRVLTLTIGTPESAWLTPSGEDQWTFRGHADTAVTVELTSEEFDTYVELFGPSGALVAANDDGGDGMDSTIRDHALDASGDYTVVARGYDDAAEGRYSLLLSRGVVDDRVLTLTIGTPESAWLTPSGEDQWTFRGRADTAVTVELTSEEFDTYVELFGPSGALVAANDDGGEDTDSTIRDHALDANGDYTVVARSYGNLAGGPYTLSVRRASIDPPSREFRDCDECPVMVVMPAGRFRMGCVSDTDCRNSELPVHEVVVAPFALSKYEVTFQEYDLFASATGRREPNDSGWGRGNSPVVDASWDDASAYVEWLSSHTGRDYHLPSEAEWEYAARAGTETRYSWGQDIGRNRANCYNCGSLWDGRRTAPVGSFPGNAWGLHDMHGNVWEWVDDCSHVDYEGAPLDGLAWTTVGDGADCGRSVLRGGSWSVFPVQLRSAHRSTQVSGHKSPSIGFRVARALE